MTAAADLVMPKLGLTMTEGLVSEWLVENGAGFKAGEVIVVVETDKIANEIDAPGDGVLERILVPVGETVPVGTPIARWIPAAGTAAKSGPAASAPKMPPAAAPPPTAAAREPGTRIVATPLARRLARELGIDLGGISGGGAGGRIKAGDVRKAAAERPLPAVAAPAPAGERRPATRFESMTARRLGEVKQGVPHFYLATEAEVSQLERFRDQVNARDGQPRVSITHIILMAVARALSSMPEANRVWSEDSVIALPTIDIGLAVHTDKGLMVPVLRDTGSLALREIAVAARDLADRARNRRLTADDIGGGAITVSNAGMHDVTYMTSIITPGQSSILGVGGIREVFRPDDKGRPALRRELGLVLSCDHRIFDGVGGLALVNRIKANLEEPLKLESSTISGK